jgi:TPR repeat protein
MNALKLRVIKTVKQRILTYRNLVLVFISVAVLTPSAWGLKTTQIMNKAAQGDKSAAYFLGVMYRTGSGVSQDCNKSMKWTEQAASQGHALAQSHLGVMYRNGCGETVNKNLTEAYFWTSLAAKQGLQFAKNNLKGLEEQLHPYLINEVQQRVENFKPTKLY